MDRNEPPRSGRGPEAVVSPEALQWARKAISDAGEELISDLGAAERHLTLLDETAERFLLCTFDDVKLPDGKKRENKKLTKSFYSTLEECAQKLAKLNQQGAGIFVLVNESNLDQGRDRERPPPRGPSHERIDALIDLTAQLLGPLPPSGGTPGRPAADRQPPLPTVAVLPCQ